jgi:dolichol-phosphate mannosyltransferase
VSTPEFVRGRSLRERLSGLGEMKAVRALMIPAMDAEVTGVSIIVPTLREASNIDALVRRVCVTLGESGLVGEVIIVDDDSRDGSVEIVERLARDLPVRIEVRTESRGLSSAVVHGFGVAAHDCLVVMDADLQHSPEDVPRLVAPIAAGRADMVFGSRYMAGGSLAKDWPMSRRIESAVASILARPLVRLSDPMSGFFALKREVWERAQPIRDVGFKIGLEIAARSGDARFAEIPITFAARQGGASKLSPKQRMQYLRQLAHLYWSRLGG